jgi:hypothetical protein
VPRITSDLLPIFRSVAMTLVRARVRLRAYWGRMMPSERAGSNQRWHRPGEGQRQRVGPLISESGRQSLTVMLYVNTVDPPKIPV